MDRIAFVIASLSSGGAERTVSKLSIALSSNYNIDIILNDLESITYPFNGNVVSLGLKPQKNRLKFGYQLNVMIKRIYILFRLKKKYHYKAVLSFSESASIANIISGRKYGKVIVSVRINLTKSERILAYKYIANPAVKKMYGKANRVVAISKGVEQDLINNFNLKNTTAILNGFDLSIIESRMNERLTSFENELIKHENTIITMGRLEVQKGQWHLIRALSLVKNRGIHFRLLILGTGSLMKYLESLIEHYRLKNEIWLIGFLDNPFRIMKRAKIFVFPSLFEGFGNALVEAMCCGLPCISSDYESGAREILAPDTDIHNKTQYEIEYAKYGLLVPVCDGKQYTVKDELTKEEILLAEAIILLLTNKELYNDYLERIPERVSQLDINTIAKQWIDEIDGQ